VAGNYVIGVPLVVNEPSGDGVNDCAVVDHEKRGLVICL
jgi:hypothetical protein